MTLVSTVTVPSGGVSAIQITNIPQTGKDLVSVWALRVSGTAQIGLANLNLNNTSSGIGKFQYMQMLDSTFSSGGVSSVNTPQLPTNAAGSTANTFSVHNVYVSNYSSTSKTKKILSLSAADTSGTPNSAPIRINIGQMSGIGTAAVTSISYVPALSVAAGSTLSLYITK